MDNLTTRERDNLTDTILEGVRDLDPGQVFEPAVLLDWVRKNYDVETAFPAGDLEDWAKDNGYVQEVVE